MIEDNRYFWSHLKTKTVTVRVRPRSEPAGIVFRVSNMIDVGKGRQTVVLDHVDHLQPGFKRPRQEGVSIPFRMGKLDFVYTSRQNPAVQNVGVLLNTLYKDARIERIVTDVLAPGDILVFKPQKDGVSVKMAEAFRIVKEKSIHQTKAGYAV